MGIVGGPTSTPMKELLGKVKEYKKQALDLLKQSAEHVSKHKLFHFYLSVEYFPPWVRLKTEQQLRIKDIPENEPLKLRWANVQKEAAVTLIGEICSHHSNLANLGEAILQYKDHTSSEQKKLLKELEVADKRLEDSVLPFVTSFQEVYEKKVLKVKEDMAKAATSPMEQESSSSTSSPPNSGQKKLTSPSHSFNTEGTVERPTRSTQLTERGQKSSSQGKGSPVQGSQMRRRRTLGLLIKMVVQGSNSQLQSSETLYQLTFDKKRLR